MNAITKMEISTMHPNVHKPEKK